MIIFVKVNPKRYKFKNNLKTNEKESTRNSSRSFLQHE